MLSQTRSCCWNTLNGVWCHIHFHGLAAQRQYRNSFSVFCCPAFVNNRKLTDTHANSGGRYSRAAWLNCLSSPVFSGGWLEDSSAEDGATAGQEGRLFEGGDQWASAGKKMLLILIYFFPIEQEIPSWLEQVLSNPLHVILMCFRDCRRQRPGTRSSARASPQQRGLCCGKSRTYKPRWADKLRPGRNWRRTFPIG